MVIECRARGQTTIDFALGAAILLLGVGFVILMAPNLFTPFAEGQSADPLTSDRIADHLVEDRFVDDGANVLNETKTVEFFEGSNDSIADELQSTEFRQLNVSLESQSGGESFQRGPDLPETSGQVTQSQRVVLLDDETYWLYVRVW